jgi:hypothetical protein
MVNALSPVIHCQLDASTKSFVVLEPPRKTAASSLNPSNGPSSALQAAAATGKRVQFVPARVAEWASKVRWRPQDKTATHVWVMNGEEETFVRSGGARAKWTEYHGGVLFATFNEVSMSAGRLETTSVPGMHAIGDRLPVAHLFDEERKLHVLLNSTSSSWKQSQSDEWGRLGLGQWRKIPV